MSRGIAAAGGRTAGCYWPMRHHTYRATDSTFNRGRRTAYASSASITSETIQARLPSQSTDAQGTRRGHWLYPMAGSLERSVRMNSTSIRLTSVSDAESDSHRISLRNREIPPLLSCEVPHNEADPGLDGHGRGVRQVGPRARSGGGHLHRQLRAPRGAAGSCGVRDPTAGLSP
jgi:hypothetical protein